MVTNAHTERWAHRAGCKVGRVWRGVVHQEQRAVLWFVRRGWPAGLAKVVLWAFKLIVLGVLLYVAFWLALVLVFLTIVVWVARADTSGKQEEWPFMSHDELRESPFYDPVQHNDANHEMYEKK